MRQQFAYGELLAGHSRWPWPLGGGDVMAALGPLCGPVAAIRSAVCAALTSGRPFDDTFPPTVSAYS
jgi:hypothetical protein